MDKRYYIAYGSNLHIEQMLTRCPSARIVGTSKVEGYRLLFKGSRTGSYLTIEPAEDRSVEVGVWEVTSDDEQRLDCYEGFPRFYYKKDFILPVKGIKSGKIRDKKVFVYIMREDSRIGLPSETYFSVCAEGFRRFGFDTAALVEALAFSGEALANERV